MSKNKSNIEDRPIWLTSLAEADHDLLPALELDRRIQTRIAGRRRMMLLQRAGSVALAASLVLALWIPSRFTSSHTLEVVDESVSEAIADAINVMPDDESDFVPTKLAAEQPLESVRVVRVSLPPGALSHYGLIATDGSAGGNVTADLLLGQDGIARAVRVVK